MTKHKGRVALVTGSTSGIGAAIARQLSSEGFSVALHSRSSQEAGLRLADALGDASYTKADLANEDDARQLVHSVLSHHGRLDVLVNNAAVGEVIAHHELRNATPRIWRELYDVNVIAPWVLVTEAEKALLDARAAQRHSQHHVPCRCSAKGGFHTLCGEQSRAESYDQAAGAQFRAGH